MNNWCVSKFGMSVSVINMSSTKLQSRSTNTNKYEEQINSSALLLSTVAINSKQINVILIEWNKSNPQNPCPAASNIKRVLWSFLLFL